MTKQTILILRNGLSDLQRVTPLFPHFVRVSTEGINDFHEERNGEVLILGPSR